MKHLIKFSMVPLAIVSTYFVFDVMKIFVPTWVAVVSSISLASVYVGLASANVDRQQRGTALSIAGIALAIEASFGIMHALRVLMPTAFDTPPMWAIVVMIILYGASFSVLLFAVSHFVVHQETAERDDPMLALVQHIAVIAQASASTMPEMLGHLTQLAQASENGLQASTKAARVFSCPNCQAELTQGQYGAAMRHGYCQECKPVNGNISTTTEEINQMEVLH